MKIKIIPGVSEVLVVHVNGRYRLQVIGYFGFDQAKKWSNNITAKVGNKCVLVTDLYTYFYYKLL